MRQLETHARDPLHKADPLKPGSQAPGAERAGRRPEQAPSGPIEALPEAHAARSLRQSAVLHMQRRHGNAFVQRQIEATQIQAEDAPVEEQAPMGASGPEQAPPGGSPAEQNPMETPSPPVEEQVPTEGDVAGPAPAEGAPTQIGGAGSSVRAESGGVTIDGGSLTVSTGMVNLNSALVTTSGVLRTPTLVADSVVATTYTPGVGNVW